MSNVHISYFYIGFSVGSSLASWTSSERPAQTLSVPPVVHYLQDPSSAVFVVVASETLFCPQSVLLLCVAVLCYIGAQTGFNCRLHLFHTDTSRKRHYWDTLLSLHFRFSVSTCLPCSTILFQTWVVLFHLLSVCHTFCFLSPSVLWYLFANPVWNSPLLTARGLVVIKMKSGILVLSEVCLPCWTCCSCHTGLHHISGQHNCHFSFGLSFPVSSRCSQALFVWSSSARLQPVNPCCPLHQISLHYVLVRCSSNTLLLISFEIFLLSPWKHQTTQRKTSTSERFLCLSL